MLGAHVQKPTMTDSELNINPGCDWSCLVEFNYSVESFILGEAGQASTDERGPENDEEVGENRTQERVLEHSYFALLKGDYGYDELCCIPNKLHS